MLERITESAWVCSLCRMTITQPLAEAQQGITPEHNCEATRAQRKRIAEEGQRYYKVVISRNGELEIMILCAHCLASIDDFCKVIRKTKINYTRCDRCG